MIGYNYINELESNPVLFDPYYIYVKETEEMESNIDLLYEEYCASKKLLETYNMFLEADDEKVKNASKKTEEKERGFVGSVGKAFIRLFEAIKNFFSNIIEKVKNLSFSAKSDLEKLEAYAKKNPTTAEDLKVKVEEGEITLTDMKSLAELEKTYQECMVMLDKKDTDPNSIKAKWEEAKKKFESIPKSPIFGTIKAVGGALGGILAIREFKKKLNSCEQNINESKLMAYQIAKDQGFDSTNTDRFMMKYKMSQAMSGYCTKAGEENYGTINKIKGWVATMLGKIDEKMPGSSVERNNKFFNKMDRYKKAKQSKMTAEENLKNELNNSQNNNQNQNNNTP